MWSELVADCIAEGSEPDRLFEALAHRRRRMVLARLGESETGLSLEQLSQEVAALEADAPATDVPAEAASEVYLTLYHVHVPKLAEAELVEYDRASDVVALAAHARPLDERVGQLSVG